jgi:hypothetical protein
MANEVSNIYEPPSCRNFDVTGAVDRLDRVLYELCTSESAVTNDFNEYDRNRFTANWAEVQTYISAIQSQDRLDLPHSFPAMYVFRYISKDTNVEWESVKNAFVRDLARLVVNAMVQLSRSESADQSNKYIPADISRWNLLFARGNDMVTQYAQVALPGDKPESSDFELGQRT